MNQYQLIIIGGGPGGYDAAIRAAQLGIRTAVVENRDVGGTCLNRGCIPTKTLMHSAELVNEMRESEQFGVTAENITFDFGRIHARKTEVSTKLRSGIEQMFLSNGIDLIRGTGTITGEGIVRVASAEGERTFTADKILIATGSVPARPPIPGLDQEGVITSDELLQDTDHVFNSLVIIGGGVIGMEFASVYSAFGCQVTVIEALAHILPNMDREIAQNLGMIMKKKGVNILAGCQVSDITRDESGLCVNYINKDKAESVHGEAVLCAIGRRPNTAGLLGEGITLEMERGFLVVDDHFETSMKNVYAVGDVSSRVQLAHVASAQGIAAVEMMAGKEPAIIVTAIPGCIYTTPEIASIGITADEAKANGRAVKTGKYVMYANGKTIIKNGARGFIKIVADAETDVILGAQLMCERATDMISELTTAVVNGLTVEQMLKVMRPHPTFNEGITDALENVGK